MDNKTVPSMHRSETLAATYSDNFYYLTVINFDAQNVLHSISEIQLVCNFLKLVLWHFVGQRKKPMGFLRLQVSRVIIIDSKTSKQSICTVTMQKNITGSDAPIIG